MGSVPEPSAVPAGPHISSLLNQPPTSGAQGAFHQKQMKSPPGSSAALPSSWPSPRTRFLSPAVLRREAARAPHSPWRQKIVAPGAGHYHARS